MLVERRILDAKQRQAFKIAQTDFVIRDDLKGIGINLDRDWSILTGCHQFKDAMRWDARERDQHFVDVADAHHPPNIAQVAQHRNAVDVRANRVIVRQKALYFVAQMWCLTDDVRDAAPDVTRPNDQGACARSKPRVRA